MTDTKLDWIADKILGQEETLMDTLAAKRLKDADDGTPSPADQPPEPLSVDPAAEQAAFAELLKFIADNPEDDCEFTALTLDEFAAETFTPPTDSNQE